MTDGTPRMVWLQSTEAFQGSNTCTVGRGSLRTLGQLSLGRRKTFLGPIRRCGDRRRRRRDDVRGGGRAGAGAPCWSSTMRPSPARRSASPAAGAATSPTSTQRRRTTSRRIPSFAISALRRYTQADFIALVERYGIAYHEKTLGQLFCDGSSRQIVDLLLSEMRQANVELRLATSVRSVEKASDGFTLDAVPGRGALPLARRGIAAASRSRRWAPPASATISRSNSA